MTTFPTFTAPSSGVAMNPPDTSPATKATARQIMHSLGVEPQEVRL